MVSRIVLSLRKAAQNSTVHHDDWTVNNLTTFETGESSLLPNHEIEFRRREAFPSGEE
jgi:hypothetical protein